MTNYLQNQTSWQSNFAVLVNVPSKGQLLENRDVFILTSTSVCRVLLTLMVEAQI